MEIKSKSNNSLVNKDIELLNLNNQNPVDIGKGVMDYAWQILKTKLENKHPNTPWTKRMIQNEIDQWGSCQFGI